MTIVLTISTDDGADSDVLRIECADSGISVAAPAPTVPVRTKDLSFEEVLSLMKVNRRAVPVPHFTRKAWDDKRRYIRLPNCSAGNEVIRIRTYDHESVWHPRSEDLFATDWTVI